MTPARAGLPTSARRRVRGLRRGGVGTLADSSMEYYVRLEQGRAGSPSPEVLDALARALGLDDVERAHLHDLTGRRPAAGRPPAAPVRPGLAHLLTRLENVAALVIDHRMDVLGWNRLAALLFFDFDAATARERNLARFAFLDPGSRERFADWPDVARATAGALRLAAGRHGRDRALATLIGELMVGSADFRELWSGRDVRERTDGQKRFRHPVVGELTLAFENFDLPGGTGQRMVTFTAPAGDPGLDLLAMWTAPVSGRASPGCS